MSVKRPSSQTQVSEAEVHQPPVTGIAETVENGCWPWFYLEATRMMSLMEMMEPLPGIVTPNLTTRKEVMVATSASKESQSKLCEDSKERSTASLLYRRGAEHSEWKSFTFIRMELDNHRKPFTAAHQIGCLNKLFKTMEDLDARNAKENQICNVP